MRKIPTLFERGEGRNRRYVIDKVNELAGWFTGTHGKVLISEKLDGTNVRLTVRSEQLVRVEKRRNPSKKQKNQGIFDPWYVDASEDDPGDKWMLQAAHNTSLRGIPDGEHSAEALGPKIQGNPLNLDTHRCVIFSLGMAPHIDMAPSSYGGLKVFLRDLDSLYAPGHLAEGLVFLDESSGRMAKIKRSDFNYKE